MAQRFIAMITLIMDETTKNYWDNRYLGGRSSGYGSYDEQLTQKLDWLKDLPITSIADIGCGDFNFGENLLKLYPQASYIGYDISEVIVKRNKQRYPYGFTTNFPPLGSDLNLCIDVLYHVLNKNEYLALLINLKQALRFGKYLAITAYEKEQWTDYHMKIRKFDYKAFGEPIIRKIIEKQGSQYFYLYENK